MNGCEWLKCQYMIDGKCTNETEAETPEGEPCCPLRDDAIIIRGDKQEMTTLVPEEEVRCPACDGTGYDIAPEHHPSCDGNCKGLCPIPRQVQCDKCGGVGYVRP